MEIQAQEKAQELFDKCKSQIVDIYPFENVKAIVTISCDEILDILEDDGVLLASSEYHDKKTVEFWLLVKDKVKNCK